MILKLDKVLSSRRRIIFLLILLSVFSLSAIVTLQLDANQHITVQTRPVRVIGEAKASSVTELPFGRQTLIPNNRFVGLYGTPGSRVLGSLGQQSLAETIKRTKKLAARYQLYTSQKVIPTLEIIATVASAEAGKDGNYSRELDPSKFDPWIAAAKENGMYVILDLQPGRSNFLKQAKLFEKQLKEPHVGLALDPEWRLKSNQVHLKQIGSVSAREVNQVSGWLADLVKTNQLPQKMFLIHQFRLSMLPNRQKIDATRNELSYIIQMDGQGLQGNKLETWRNIKTKAPENFYFGWKNFYKMDPKVRSPKDTMAIEPMPWYISYQ